MLIFDQCRISDNGSRLYLNFHVNYAHYFDNVMLDSVTIVTADKVNETDPGIPTSDYIYKKVYTEDLQVDGLVIDKSVLDEAFNNWDGYQVINPEKPHARVPFNKANFSSDLFFIYVKCKGAVAPDTPCRMDEEITLGVTFDEHVLYQNAMGFTKSLADTCNIPVGFTDFILLWNAFKVSLETEHYVPAIKFFDQLFGQNGAHTPYNKLNTPKPCGCHG